MFCCFQSFTGQSPCSICCDICWWHSMTIWKAEKYRRLVAKQARTSLGVPGGYPPKRNGLSNQFLIPFGGYLPLQKGSDPKTLPWTAIWPFARSSCGDVCTQMNCWWCQVSSWKGQIICGVGCRWMSPTVLGRCWSGKTSMRSSDVSVMFWFWLGFWPIVGVGGALRAVSLFRATFSPSLQLSHENLWCSYRRCECELDWNRFGLLWFCGVFSIGFLPHITWAFQSQLRTPQRASGSENLAVAIHSMKTVEHIFCIRCRTTLVICK